MVAGVAGAPVQHSLSPFIHNAWLTAARVDGVYVPFSPVIDGFGDFVRGLRGGALRGLNITVPFKLEALELADRRTDRAIAAGAANLLVFETSGEVFADNTDGEGLLAALVEQAAGFAADAGPAVIIGAGGAARGAAAALLDAGAPEIRILNRSTGRAENLREQLGPRIRVLAGSRGAFEDANVVINATTLGLGGEEGPDAPFAALPRTAIVMDMVLPASGDELPSTRAIARPANGRRAGHVDRPGQAELSGVLRCGAF